MERETNDYVRVDKTEFALLLLRLQQDQRRAEHYCKALGVYEMNIRQNIRDKKFTSTIRINRELKKELYA